MFDEMVASKNGERFARSFPEILPEFWALGRLTVFQTVGSKNIAVESHFLGL